MDELRLFVVSNDDHDYDENSDVVVIAASEDEAVNFALPEFPGYRSGSLSITEHAMKTPGIVFVAFHPG